MQLGVVAEHEPPTPVAGHAIRTQAILSQDNRAALAERDGAGFPYHLAADVVAVDRVDEHLVVHHHAADGFKNQDLGVLQPRTGPRCPAPLQDAASRYLLVKKPPNHVAL